MTRGGKREGAGRPLGTKKEPTTAYYRRVKPQWVEVLDNVLNELKEKKGLQDEKRRYDRHYN